MTYRLAPLLVATLICCMGVATSPGAAQAGPAPDVESPTAAGPPTAEPPTAEPPADAKQPASGPTAYHPRPYPHPDEPSAVNPPKECWRGEEGPGWVCVDGVGVAIANPTVGYTLPSYKWPSDDKPEPRKPGRGLWIAGLATTLGGLALTGAGAAILVSAAGTDRSELPGKIRHSIGMAFGSIITGLGGIAVITGSGLWIAGAVKQGEADDGKTEQARQPLMPKLMVGPTSATLSFSF